VLISPEARPASCCCTPASAAIETGIQVNGRAKPTRRYPGRRSLANDACAGIWAYQTIPAVIATNPIAITGFGPTFVERNWARPAQATALPAVAAKVTPVFSAE
jgi:hypothetical protein